MDRKSIQSMFTPFDKMSIGTSPYGAEVIAEKEILPGIVYALIHERQFKSYPRPKSVNTYSVRRFQWNEIDGFWDETSFYRCDNKANAKKVFKVSTT